MSKGKWFFVYRWNDTFGGGLGGTWEDKEIPLETTNEEGAVAQATVMWNEEVEKAKANWEVQKKTWAHPPESPFTDGPTNPRVIYKILLQ